MAIVVVCRDQDKWDACGCCGFAQRRHQLASDALAPLILSHSQVIDEDL
jgi:hypothetical protein